MQRYDYANILFSGRCNLRCYECIGSHYSLKNLPYNAHEFPPKNIDGLMSIVNSMKVPDLAFTGTMDPQLYVHEKKLIDHIRESMREARNDKTRLSVHTNGHMILKDPDLFNSYDKASISLPSYDPATYRKICHGRFPDIRKIIDVSKIPLKLSMLITPFNIAQIPDYIKKSRDIGIKRIVIRKLYGRDDEYPLEHMPPFCEKEPIKSIFSWPVYDFDGLELTICGFGSNSAKGIYLFSDGRLSPRLISDHAQAGFMPTETVSNSGESIPYENKRGFRNTRGLR